VTTPCIENHYYLTEYNKPMLWSIAGDYTSLMKSQLQVPRSFKALLLFHLSFDDPQPFCTVPMDSGSSSNSSSMRICKYDVFLSFRGPDTPKKVSSSSRTIKLSRKENQFGLSFYKLFEIQEFLVVFSKNYSKSTWCLVEMAAIHECHSKLNRNVISVFYNVESSWCSVRDTDTK